MRITGLKSTSRQRTAELRAELLPLAENCPVEACLNPEDCPLHMVRTMNAKQRLKWFNGLSEDGLSYLATYCHVCLNTRLAQNSAE